MYVCIYLFIYRDSLVAQIVKNLLEQGLMQLQACNKY